MRKLFLVAAVLLVGLLLTAMEVKWIQNEKNTELIQVVGVINPLDAGEILERGNLTMYELLLNQYHDGYYRDYESVVGKTALVDFTEKTLIYDGILKEEAYDVPRPGNSLTALKLDPESALCWSLDIGEPILAVYVGDDGGYNQLGNVTVKGLFDNYMESDGVPTFVLVEGQNKTVENIIRYRSLGRIELIKQAFNQNLK